MSTSSLSTSGFVPVRSFPDADTIIRSVLFLSVFVAVWISFHPFPSLAAPPQNLSSAGGDLANQVGFSTIFLVMAAWSYWHEPKRLALLIYPALIGVVMWCVLSVLTSWQPLLAARRLTFALIVMCISAMTLLLPKNQRHFADLLSAAALIVLIACFLGVVFAPEYSIHQATDFVEPEHAGEWRGVFPHKNDAGATMVLFIFIGFYVARIRSVIMGALIVVLATIFLAFTQSKTAIGVLPLALLISFIIGRSRRAAVGIGLVIMILIIFNLCSVGTVMFEPVRNLMVSILPDASFTGRTEIWQVGIDAVAQRPLTGYGYSGFWGTPEVLYGFGENSSWVDSASDAHNAYLNLALTIGVPGMLLVVWWAIVMPIRDICHQNFDTTTRPLQMLFLRVCIYGVYASCFESSILTQVGEVWFFYMTSIFGLRYLSVARIRPW